MKKWLWIVLVALIAVLPRFPYLNVPYERDEGGLAYMADVIVRGGVPYVDTFDHKPPGAPYLYALSYTLFGRSISAPRIMVLFFTLATCLLSYALVYTITGDPYAGAFTMLFLGLAGSSPAYQGFNSNFEQFTLPFLVGGTLLLAEDDPPPSRYLFSGILFGLAFMVKQMIVPVAAAAFLCSAARLIRRPGQLAASSALFGAGSALPFLTFAAFMLSRGGFADFWAQFYSYNVSYVERSSLLSGWPFLRSSMLDNLSSDPFTWIMAGAGLVALLVSRARLFHKALSLSLLVGSFIGVSMGKYYYKHYYVIALPFLVLGAGLALAQYANRIVKRGLWALFLALFACSVAFNVRYFTTSHENLLKSLYGFSPFHQSVSLGNYLRSQSPGGASVYILGSEAQIAFYAGFTIPSRIIYFYPLTSPSRLKGEYRREVLDDLRKNLPDYLLEVNLFSSHFMDWRSDRPFLTELYGLFSGYRLTAVSSFGVDTVQTDPEFLLKVQRTKPQGTIFVYRKS